VVNEEAAEEADERERKQRVAGVDLVAVECSAMVAPVTVRR